MRRHSLLTLIVAALAVSCSKKKENRPAESPPIDKGTPGEVADDTPPEPNPDKPSSPPAAAVAIDCEKLFTADDVAKACGGNAAGLEVQKNPMETGNGSSACMRNALAKGNRVYLLVNAGPGTPANAREILELAKGQQNAKAVEVADGAYLHVTEVAAAKQTVHELEAVKGALWFKLGFEVQSGDKKPICTDDGLVELGKTVAGKLP